MKSVNKVTLLGNLGQNPETFGEGLGCNFSVATSKSWRDKDSGEQKEKTEWHRITAYRKLGEICAQYLTKGSKVYLEGELQTRKWDDKDGNVRYTTEIIIDEMVMLDTRSGAGEPSRPEAGQATPQPSTNQQEQLIQKDDWDDDIPF